MSNVGVAEETSPPAGGESGTEGSSTDDPTTARSLLLELPGELRNRIYRYALVAQERIELLTSENKKQPALLGVSRQVRRETIKIYYDENSFGYNVVDLAGAPGEPFFELVRRYRSEGRKNFMTHRRGGRNWSNLLAWVKARFECQHFPPALAGSQSNHAGHRVVHAAFDIAREMRSQPWSNVEAVLEAFHRGVKAADPAWA